MIKLFWSRQFKGVRHICRELLDPNFKPYLKPLMADISENDYNISSLEIEIREAYHSFIKILAVEKPTHSLLNNTQLRICSVFSPTLLLPRVEGSDLCRYIRLFIQLVLSKFARNFMRPD